MSNPEWTSRLPNTSHVQLFKDVDWAATDLGPLPSWGPSLRFAASMVFADSRGACVYWGPRRTAFYNEAFVPMARGAHPRLMGNSFDVVFPELVASIRPIFEKATSDGMTEDVDHIPLTVERDGYVEETYFTGQFIPLTDDNGVCGIYNTTHESTFRVLHDRRRLVLDHIMALPSVSVSSVFQHLIGAMETNPNDVPMALAYSADETTGTCQLTLQGSIGVPDGHEIAPLHGELHQTKSGLFPLLRKAHLKKTPLVLSTTDADWDSILKGVQWAGFGEPSRELLISPLASAARVFGFFVIATNPRRKYDVHYEQFVNDVTQQLLAKLNSAISIEESRRREEALLRDLAESESRIRYMADHSPVGMVYHKREGEVVWANQQFYDIIGITEEEAADVETVIKCYHDDDIEKTTGMWEELIRGSGTISGELRLKRTFVTPEGESEHAWLLVHGFSLKGEGEVKYIMACLTDISRIKWAESIQNRNAIAAQEAKRRQEEFIDLISHELRNPLGAMTIGAETISNCINNSKSSQDGSGLLELLNENVHIAETILECASHQKRIIDDVLLLSRLESQILTITPVLTNLVTLVESARRMFSGECKQHDIALNVIRHRSCVDLQAESVMCDPSRLMQIIINVLANGIKFVRPEPKREISLTYGVAKSVSELHALNPLIRWCPSPTFDNPTVDDHATATEWGTGQPLYVFFAIKDSGPGLDQKEIDHLFQRFAQTTKLTHVHYGGSGLGLYISRELAEKHGGEIGIDSQKGAGATFTFYIKTERDTVDSSSTTQSSPHPQHHKPSDHTTLLSSLSVQDNSNLIGKRASTTTSIAKISNTKLQILLAEDNLVNQKFLTRGLERHGYDVLVANHGVEAIDILKRTASWDHHRPASSHATTTTTTTTAIANNMNGTVPQPLLPRIDLILMDWEMPILDGLAASKRIRGFEKAGLLTRRIPIVAITANARQEQIQRALDAGMDDVLPKPFLVSELVAKVEGWRVRIENGTAGGAGIARTGD